MICTICEIKNVDDEDMLNLGELFCVKRYILRKLVNLIEKRTSSIVCIHQSNA